MSHMISHLNTALYTAKRSAIREFSALAKATPGCIALTLGEPEFDTPAAVREAAKEALDAGETHYIANPGAPEVRQAVADFERRENGFVCDPSEVILTAGATEALFTALFGILNPGDEVIIPQPAFLLYEEIVNLCRGVTVKLVTAPDGFQIRKEKLEALITPRTKAIVINTPNNPTGCVLDAESLAAVRDAALAHDLFVIADDVYRQLSYGAEKPGSAADFPELKDRLLLVQSFSKPYAMTGWRMGYLIADAPLMERLSLVHQYCVVSTPAPFQRAALAALAESTAAMRETYRKRRDCVCERLEAMGLPAVRPDGAFYVFPSIEQTGMTSDVFCRRLITEAGVAATPGFCFGQEGYIRFSYCCADEDLAEGMNRLERFLKGAKA